MFFLKPLLFSGLAGFFFVYQITPFPLTLWGIQVELLYLLCFALVFCVPQWQALCFIFSLAALLDLSSLAPRGFSLFTYCFSLFPLLYFSKLLERQFPLSLFLLFALGAYGIKLLLEGMLLFWMQDFFTAFYFITSTALLELVFATLTAAVFYLLPLLFRERVQS